MKRKNVSSKASQFRLTILVGFLMLSKSSVSAISAAYFDQEGLRSACMMEGTNYLITTFGSQIRVYELLPGNNQLTLKVAKTISNGTYSSRYTARCISYAPNVIVSSGNYGISYIIFDPANPSSETAILQPTPVSSIYQSLELVRRPGTNFVFAG